MNVPTCKCRRACVWVLCGARNHLPSRTPLQHIRVYAHTPCKSVPHLPRLLYPISVSRMKIWLFSFNNSDLLQTWSFYLVEFATRCSQKCNLHANWHVGKSKWFKLIAGDGDMDVHLHKTCCYFVSHFHFYFVEIPNGSKSQRFRSYKVDHSCFKWVTCTTRSRVLIVSNFRIFYLVNWRYERVKN